MKPRKHPNTRAFSRALALVKPPGAPAFAIAVLLLAAGLFIAAPVVASTLPGQVEAQVADQSNSGHGPTSYTVTLDKGLTVFDTSVTGNQGNFIVWVVRSDETTTGLIANLIGDGHGTVALRAPTSGQYRVMITKCSGDWSITVRQPRATTAPSTRAWSGQGESVVDLFYLKVGTYKFTGAQQGERNFIVHLVDLDGQTAEFLANEIGDDAAQKVFVVKKAGVYALSVDADGPWNLSIASHHITFRLTALSVPVTAKPQKWFTVSVRMTPVYIGVTSSPVTVYAQKKSGARWVNTMHVHPWGSRYATYSKYSARLYVSKGTWRVWAEFKDAEHAKLKTGYKSVSVK